MEKTKAIRSIGDLIGLAAGNQQPAAGSSMTGRRCGAQNKLDEKPPSTGMAAPVT
jgi:hypothetical protein